MEKELLQAAPGDQHSGEVLHEQEAEIPVKRAAIKALDDELSVGAFRQQLVDMYKRQR